MEKIMAKNAGEAAGQNLLTVERLCSGIVQEEAHPVIEAIKRDASSRPYQYVRNYTVPAEGE